MSLRGAGGARDQNTDGAPPQSGSSTFLFVEVASTGKVPADKELRTRMQKHVMRDIGRKRQGRTRPKKSRPISVLASANAEVDNPELEQVRRLNAQNRSSQISRSVSGSGRTDPFVKYPIEMDSETLLLIDHVYSSPHSYLTPFKDSWLLLSLVDPAPFHELLSNVALHVASLRPGPLDRQRATKHHAAAVWSVNKRLPDPVEGISDGIVTSIMAFACFSHSTGDWQTYDTHMAGLQTIMKLRGGIKSIDNNKTLRLLLSGIDIASATFHNRPTHFSIFDTDLSDLETSSSEHPWALSVDGISTLWEHFFPDDPILSSVFSNICTVNMTIKSQSSKGLQRNKIWESTTFVSLSLQPLIHSLLEYSIKIKSITPENFMSESCRLAALLFLAKIRRKCASAAGRPRQHFVFTNLETSKLRTILELYHEQWSMFRPLLLWVCVIGALSEEVDEEKTWWIELTARKAQDMGFGEKHTWSGAVALLRGNLLWLGDVLDRDLELLGRDVVALFPLVTELETFNILESVQ